MIKFTIYGNPIVKKNTRPVYVNKATGKRFIGKSKRLKEYENNSVMQLKKFKRLYYKLNSSGEVVDDFPISNPIQVMYKFYRGTRHKVDTSNLIEAPQDCLIKAGIISDDSIIKKITAEKFYDKDNPRTEIEIEVIDNDK